VTNSRGRRRRSHHHPLGTCQWYGCRRYGPRPSPMPPSSMPPNDSKLNAPPGAPRSPCRRSTGPGRTRPAHGICHACRRCTAKSTAAARICLCTSPRHPAALFRHPIAHPSRQTVFTTTVPLLTLLHTKRNLSAGALALESRDGRAGEPIALTRLATDTVAVIEAVASGLSTL